ncbi:hypothetical protein HPULCUR_011100 [Helicostylum pulchrum]|uniref:Cas12f1-like TNB domain-containing protein n=1 Tax=Helicostylum pulchrum TaxID=562976 RepID=A0ABP9YF78_9FUNG
MPSYALKLAASQTGNNNEGQAEGQAEEERCKRCRQPGHKDARSPLCQRSKREREDDTDEGRPRKRQEVPGSSTSQQGSISSAVASTSTSIPASGGTRSTTATIRAGARNIPSEAQNFANRRARAAGKDARRRVTRNPNPVKPCPTCTKKGRYDTATPHSSRRSVLCPGYVQSTDEFIEESVGKGYRRFIRKHGLQDLVILEQRVKEVFLRKISESVNDYRQVAIKSQLFASYYIRNRLSRNLPLPPIVFHQAFFYACIQRTIGRNITNTNPNLPRANINAVFEQYDGQFLNNRVAMEPGRNVHANALASMANISAQNLVNHVSENYTKTLRNYIKIRLKEVFNLNAGDINRLCQYVLNNSVHSSTRVTWPETIQNTPNNIALVNTIIGASRITNEPVTMTLMTTNPGLFLQHMYQILLYFKKFNNDNIRTFNEVQTEASYVWMKQVLSGNGLFKVFNRKKRNRLSFLALRSLRDNINLENTLQLDVAQYEYIVNLIQTTRNQIINSEIYLDENNENRLNTRIRDCFRPDMALSIKQYKLFSLVPIYSFTRKYVEINIKHLRSLLLKAQREIGITLDILNRNRNRNRSRNRNRNNDDNNEGDNENEGGNENDDDNENEGDNENKHELATNGKQMFTNMVRTDGYGIDFILAGPKNPDANLPDLDLNDFTPRELNENFCLWGADPGQTNIFTASDGHGDDSHQVRKYSTAEYYTRAGFKKSNKTILNLKNGDEQLSEAERNIATFKTANMEVFLLYIHSVLNNIDVLVRFYDDRFTSLRFLNYIGRQRADAEMVNIFVTGGKKYLKREFKQTVALGDAVFPSSMKGIIPGLARRLVKKLKIAEREGLLVTVPVTEYMTSKTCSNCSRNDTENIEIDGVALFSVLLCPNQTCNTLWQRDINAPRNMHYISYNVIATGEVPAIFRR